MTYYLILLLFFIIKYNLVENALPIFLSESPYNGLVIYHT